MANFNFNKAILGGRLTADPELKTTPSGKFTTSFSIAISRRFNREEADFINVVAWGKTAEFITKYFKKGSSICIDGEIQTRSWTDQNGNKRYVTEVLAENAMFVDGKENNESSVIPGVNQPAPSYMPDSYKMDNVTDDEDLPF